METITVGNPGNAADTRYETPGYGAVDYTYIIGKFEVTAGQYCEFLNAVAKTDSYGLYNAYMDYDADPTRQGCNIKRTGSSGTYSYSVAPDWADRPVNYVSWGDAVRFANWLTNGQPTGFQNASTTEDGSYYINGATSDAALLAVTRKTNAWYVIPSEDEWYKAAYHKNEGVTGDYWEYPTGTDVLPSNALKNNDPGNNANFEAWNGKTWEPTIGSPFYRTLVGAFSNSDSPYHTFDQGGNVWEWNEAVVSGSYRGVRGGSFDYYGAGLEALARYHIGRHSVSEYPDIGFRIAIIPEPDSDGDGVPANQDQCPNTIPGVPVDGAGCPPEVPGDFDRDGDVDYADFGHLEACFSGPTIPQTDPTCANAKLDEDADADLTDFGIFQRCYSGENNPADPSCAD